MTRRTPVAAFLAAILGVGLFTAPASGQRGPSLSDDLLHHLPSGAHLHRVIIQADGDTLAGLRVRGVQRLRRSMAGSIAVEVSDDHLSALQRNAGIGHISGDLQVAPDAAITN